MKRIIVFIVVSLLMISPFAQGREVSRTDFVEGINILFLKKDYSNLVDKTEGDLGRYKLPRQEKKEVLYLTGLSYIKLNNFGKARKVFKNILSMKGNEFRQNAHIGIADSYFEEKNYERAIQAYEEVLTTYPRSDRLSSIYYNLGLSYKAKNNFSKANLYFQKIKRYHSVSLESDKTTDLSTKKKPRYYIIQLGAFRSLTNAKKLGKRLRRKKYDYYIQKIKKDGEILYRVRGGKFSNKYYAMRLFRKLRRDRFHVKIIEE